LLQRCVSDTTPNVFSLPIRNWNQSSCVPFSPLSRVFSLPIRNWNFGRYIYIFISAITFL